MANSLAGKIIGVELNGTYYKCQTDATLNLIANLTEDEACKPDPGTPSGGGIGWVTRTVDSKDWNITFSAKAFADDLQANNSEISTFFIDSDLSVEVDFQTNVTENNDAYNFVYNGDGIMSSLTLNAPTDGASTYDVEIQGNGPLTYTTIPVTT